MTQTKWTIEVILAFQWCLSRKEWSSKFENEMTGIIVNGGWHLLEIPPMCRAQIAYGIWKLRNSK